MSTDRTQMQMYKSAYPSSSGGFEHEMRISSALDIMEKEAKDKAKMNRLVWKAEQQARRSKYGCR